MVAMIFRMLLTMGVMFFSASCIIVSSSEDQTQMWNTIDGARPLIIAHRGASGYLPEHTIEAYELAIEQGADIIEPDLVVTHDGVLVVRHDRYLSTTTNVADIAVFTDRKRLNPDPNGEQREDWWVEDFTLAELKTLRARQPREGRSKEYDDQFLIPTFAEVLAAATRGSKAHNRPVGVYPETKSPGYFGTIGLDFEVPLLAALENFEAGSVFIQSFEPDILKRLKSKTNVTLVQLVYERDQSGYPNIGFEDAFSYSDGIGFQKSILLTRGGYVSDYISHSQQPGQFIHAWTLRDDDPYEGAANDQANFADDRVSKCLNASAFNSVGERELCLFFALGVDGVFTDFPDTAVKVREMLEVEHQKMLK